jgi:hypothetical protein
MKGTLSNELCSKMAGIRRDEKTRWLWPRGNRIVARKNPQSLP